MAKPDFADLYEKALGFQAKGDFAGMTSLIEEAYKLGVPEDELRILGALAEGAFQFSQTSGRP